jgi:hypothetical protein
MARVDAGANAAEVVKLRVGRDHTASEHERETVRLEGAPSAAPDTDDPVALAASGPDPEQAPTIRLGRAPLLQAFGVCHVLISAGITAIAISLRVASAVLMSLDSFQPRRYARGT